MQRAAAPPRALPCASVCWPRARWSRRSRSRSHAAPQCPRTPAWLRPQLRTGDSAEEPCITEPEGSAHIGAALAFGFVFMLLVDRLLSSPSPSPMSSTSPPHAELDSKSPRLSLTVAKPAANAFNSPVVSPVERHERLLDDEADVVQRTNLIHIPINRDLIAGSISGGVGGLTRQQSSGGEKEREVSPEKERERQRVERAKERERAHGYQPYALSNTAAATVLTPPSLSHLSSSAFSQSATLGILVHSLVDGLDASPWRRRPVVGRVAGGGRLPRRRAAQVPGGVRPRVLPHAPGPLVAGDTRAPRHLLAVRTPWRPC